jgi:hypothetical protein
MVDHYYSIAPIDVSVVVVVVIVVVVPHHEWEMDPVPFLSSTLLAIHLALADAYYYYSCCFYCHCH